MIEWLDLTARFLGVIERAQGYLEIRKERTTEPNLMALTALQQHVAAWQNQIIGIEILYQTRHLPAHVSAEERPIYATLADRLSHAEGKLGALHEYYDYRQVEQTFTEFGEVVERFLSAGPHGPGGGRPPRGQRRETPGGGP